MENKGFTLIELLVVIGVVSLLSSITGASLRTAQDRAREVIRTETKNTVLEALNAYYLDHGVYPSSGGEYVCLGPSTVTCWGRTGSDSIWNQFSPYISGIPYPNVPPGTLGYNGYKYLAPTSWPGLGAVIGWPSVEPIEESECPDGTIDHSDIYYCWQWLSS